MASRGIRFVWLLLILAGLFAGVLSYRSRERAVLAVRTFRVERQDIHAGIVTNGKAEPIVYQDARAELEGEVSQVLVREGDSVRRGQQLAELSQRQIGSEIESARSSLADAENDTCRKAPDRRHDGLR